ncbi:MAG: NAD(P)-dependent glycerol-3-phosphate dehydrogenase [Acidobacteriaceae bacterium]|nr:NAD(P)-dependent glycerol-3-phosphate dehydrogenase [Acidobacteriaceae bacterium]
MNTRLAILGTGSWGTALAMSLAPRFDDVGLWCREAGRAAEIEESRENARYLPGFRLPPNIRVSCDLNGTLEGADIVVIAIPSAHLRDVLGAAAEFLSTETRVVSATKGIEEGTLLRMSQVIGDVLRGSVSIGSLSGPTFAKEIAAGEPAAVAIASSDIAFAEEIQRRFSSASLRLYASTDLIGVEVGAALKNVIAIGAGICRGLGLGSNSVAALVTRGLAEITRLALRMGGQPRTLAGLAGLGDLVLTATGDLSRNRFVGAQLGQGRRLEQVLSGMTMVAEGVGTCRAAHELGLRHEIDLPIISRMYEVLYENKEPRQAIRELMERPLTSE